MYMVVCFRDNTPVAILAADGKRSFCDEGLPISVRMAMCPYRAERERDPSGYRASGLTPELPVHVMLVPPLLVPPPSIGVLVMIKLWILPLPATALFSRRFFCRIFCSTRDMQARTFFPTDASQ